MNLDFAVSPLFACHTGPLLSGVARSTLPATTFNPMPTTNRSLTRNRPRRHLPRTLTAALSLLEVTVAICVIGILAALWTRGFEAWRIMASKQTCVDNQARLQRCLRTHAAFANLPTGAPVDASVFLGTGSSSLMPLPHCAMADNPLESYAFTMVVPPAGSPFATCTARPLEHVPESTTGW